MDDSSVFVDSRILPPRPISGPMAQWPDVSDVLDRGPQTMGLRFASDGRTHIDRICPYLDGESYAGAGGNAVWRDPYAPVEVFGALVVTPDETDKQVAVFVEPVPSEDDAPVLEHTPDLALIMVPAIVEVADTSDHPVAG